MSPELADIYGRQLIAILLVSLRIGPTLAFAPPFTLLRIPMIVRVILSFGLSLWLVAGHAQTIPANLAGGALLIMAAQELLLGVSLSLALHLAFAALLLAGRTIDFQTGFGFSLIADPTLRSQMPLVGTLFAYAAGAIFFATSGPADLIAIWAHSLDAHPLGAPLAVTTLAPLLAYIAAVFAIGLGAAGLVLANLFVVDIAIAFMSRTLPQMNVLMLGFQAKTLALLVLLPMTFALSGAGFLRLVRLGVDSSGAWP
jgi:flagellar biosynthetic protein FliR